ncbi:hypothetical protein K9M09_01175 [Patescibacteria group bacterium]|nr:hypothetical protein [Patescibacteria group bacterium]
MKKYVFFLVLLMLISVIPRAQNVSPISRDANLSLFAGYFAKKQNVNNNGYWIGAYGDVPLRKSVNRAWNIGLYGLYVQSVWQDNLSQYSSKSDAFAIGMNTGYYNEFFSYTHTLYLGFALGYKHVQEIGRVDKKNYFSEGIQQDHLLAGSINFNLMKYSGYHERFLPRLQIIVSAEKSLNALKVLSENDAPNVRVDAWNRNYYEATAKQSIYDIPLSYSGSVFLQPKVAGVYSHYLAGDPDAYGLILEISFHRDYQDDFLSLSVMQKWNSNGGEYLFAMLNLNLLKIINK